MPYKKRGKRTKLLDLARKSRERAQARRAAKTASVNRANRLISGASPKTSSKSKPEAKAKVTRHGGTTITYKPKPSPHLKPATKKAAKKAPPKSAAKKAAPKAATKKAKKSDAQKLADWRKDKTKGMAPRNLRTPAQRAALKKRLLNLKSEASGLSDLASGLTKDIGDAEFATDLAITAATLPVGGGLGRGALTGAKAIGRGVATGARATGRTAASGARATGRVAKKAVKATKRAARKAKVGLRKADKALLKKQGLRRTRGKIERINPFKQRGTAKPKSKVKSDKKNPFAGPAKPKAKPKAKRKAKRKAKKSAPTQRSREQAKSRQVEEGYKQFDKDRKARSRKRGKI